MALTPGTRLGPYEVTAQIGEGGMGEVYRARDSKLKRDVAIKALPASLSADVARLARFQREAEVLASLNDPHIAAIYGLEEQDGQTALVLELVEGPTLADRIAQGAIPAYEPLPIAHQIALALEAAHEAGIIHRDLKPANIKVRSDGVVKVLDFGLARTLDPPSPKATAGKPSRSRFSPAGARVARCSWPAIVSPMPGDRKRGLTGFGRARTMPGGASLSSGGPAVGEWTTRSSVGPLRTTGSIAAWDPAEWASCTRCAICGSIDASRSKSHRT